MLELTKISVLLNLIINLLFLLNYIGSGYTNDVIVCICCHRKYMVIYIQQRYVTLEARKSNSKVKYDRDPKVREGKW